MATHYGFFICVGLILGAIVGNFMPFAPVLESLAGGVLGGIIAFVGDRHKDSA